MLKIIWIEMLLNTSVEDRTNYDDDYQPYHVMPSRRRGLLDYYSGCAQRLSGSQKHQGAGGSFPIAL